EGSGRQVDPARVELVRATVGCRERLADFFNCPIKLGAPTNALVFRASDLDARLPTANAVLLRVNEQAATDYMAHLDRNEIIVQVQAKLFQLLPTGELSEMQMARALNLSLRSMQRKLKEKGVTFRGLLDASRRQLAEQYLKDSTLSVSEIAYLLGFAEVSSFSRAFKRWTGRAPRAQAHVA
ncbi:MAG: AraC family transcriptional regulator, partial [Proteobacteria bacterium]